MEHQGGDVLISSIEQQLAALRAKASAIEGMSKGKSGVIHSYASSTLPQSPALPSPHYASTLTRGGQSFQSPSVPLSQSPSLNRSALSMPVVSLTDSGLVAATLRQHAVGIPSSTAYKHQQDRKYTLKKF